MTVEGFGERPSPGRTVLRYVLLVATMAAVFLCFLLLHSAFIALIAAVVPTTDGVAALYRRSLLEKVLVIVLGIAGMAAIIVCEWYYGRARGVLDLLQRFARTTAVIGFLLGACHVILLLVGSRDPVTFVLAACGFSVGAVLLVLSLVGRRP